MLIISLRDQFRRVHRHEDRRSAGCARRSAGSCHAALHCHPHHRVAFPASEPEKPLSARRLRRNPCRRDGHDPGHRMPDVPPDCENPPGMRRGPGLLRARDHDGESRAADPRRHAVRLVLRMVADAPSGAGGTGRGCFENRGNELKNS